MQKKKKKTTAKKKLKKSGQCDALCVCLMRKSRFVERSGPKLDCASKQKTKYYKMVRWRISVLRSPGSSEIMVFCFVFIIQWLESSSSSIQVFWKRLHSWECAREEGAERQRERCRGGCIICMYAQEEEHACVFHLYLRGITSQGANPCREQITPKRECFVTSLLISISLERNKCSKH